jgi:exodeoxyribonuclease V beta subunit
VTQPRDGAAFDLAEPLPGGTLAIQASAGTGKTYTLADLATRCIAEGRASASELLIVTFTRAATDELRSRVRGRLVDAVEWLAGDRTGAAGDGLLDLLAHRGDPEQLGRLQRAVSEFDAATVTTIHGFARQVLGALGVSAGADPDARLDADSSRLISDTCADVLIATAVEAGHVGPLPGLDVLSEATAVVDGRPDLALVPAPGEPGAAPADLLLRQLVERSAALVSLRRRQAGTLSFDDVLTQLRDALCRPGGEGAVATLRSRFRVALIDEFQDTDPVQWEIFSTLFDGTGRESTLILVGDPKQAIYAFRGADVHTYLRAVGGTPETTRRSLVTNWRSDDSVLRSLDALFDGATFGSPDIPFVSVGPAEANRGRYLLGGDGRPLPALAVRLAVGEGILRHKQKDHLVITSAAERAIYADLVAEVARLLDGGRLPDRADGEGHRPVRPPDIAVLVGRHAEAVDIQAALADRGIPAVVARGGSVLESPAADQMRWLLHALGRPADPRRVRMYALSWFAGRTAAQVAALSEADMEGMQEQLRQWSEMLGTHSVADVFARVWSESGVVPRVLAAADGDRNMTDLDHLVELFQGVSTGGRSGVAGLLSVLDTEARQEDDTEVDGDLSARRIASEAASVQIMTVWAAKGLEFPVVCLPTLWRPPREREAVVYVDPHSGRRTYDLSGGADWPDEAGGANRRRWAADESAGERLRLLYVAMTRARHQTVVWWAQADRSGQSALAHMLFGRRGAAIDPGAFESPSVSVPSDREVVAHLGPVVEAAGGTISVAVVDDVPARPERWRPPSGGAPAPELDLATLDRAPGRWRQRWSFSAIVDHASVGHFDPNDPSLADRGAGDEQDAAGPISPPGAAPDPTGPDPTVSLGPSPDGRGPASPLADLPAGTAFGTMVHSVLEEIDFSSARLDEELAVAVDLQLAWRSVDLAPVVPAGATAAQGRVLLIDGLRRAVETPLGPLCGGVRLADIGPGDRLTEVSFDLRLADDGLMPTVRDIGALVLDHLDPDHPLAGWATGLADGAIEVTVAGHLTGSIDLVMRVPGGPAGRRFVVADYKTNALHAREMPVGPDDYGTDRLLAAMAEHDYPLQALLYSVALHRYLRWRMPDYRPGDHLGGIAYLFLRGMAGTGTGTGTGTPSGVFEWAVPPGLVVSLSDLLAGRAQARRVA